MSTQPSRDPHRPAASALLALACVACAVPPGAMERSGPSLVVEIAALELAGVGDAIWDLEVVNGATATVWQQRITSSLYGDGKGSVSYVGPCDGSPGADQNTVRLWVVGLYDAPVPANQAGAFNAGAATGPGAVDATPLRFSSPTAAAPLTRTITCAENEDAFVRFDVTLLRPAEQGFLDLAVNFNNIFCSAKFDCCKDDGHGNCDGPIELLHASVGVRGPTHVLGFACTAGLGEEIITDLYMDGLAIDCDINSDADTFAPDITIAPDPLHPGNLCSLASGMSACAYVTEAPGVDADDYLFQAAVYRGEEALTSGAQSANKVYWNVALGVKPAISGCRLRLAATADDAMSLLDNVSNGAIAPGVVYPYLTWDIDLGACGLEQLTLDAPDAPVTATYTAIDGPGRAFAHRYAPALPHAFVGGFTELGASHIWGTGSGDAGLYYEMNGISYLAQIEATNDPPAIMWYPLNTAYSSGGVGWPAPQEILDGLVIPAGNPWKITVNARGAAETESFTFYVVQDATDAPIATFDVITQANLSTYYTYSVASVPYDIRLRVVKTTPTGFDFYIWSGTLPPGIGIYPNQDVLY